ncbi:MAG: hypothetical protein NW224_30180 [Leptolyngbyaceae cyanobacterium bins.302]|nr:hypothetical protein [Leptolyngbyaceae cyanobacterium bins.302]
MVNSISSSLLAVTGASGILQNGLTTAQGIAETWNLQWLNIFQSELYHAIVSTAGLFAAGALLFFMIQFIRRMVMEEDFATGLQSLILPLIIVCLLANNGYMLSRGTLAMRSVIHGLSNQIMSMTLMEVKLQDAVQASVDKGAVSSQINALLSQCQGMVGERQQACFKSANEQAEAIVQDYQSTHPVSNAFADFLTSMKQGVLGQGITGAIETGGGQIDTSQGIPGAIQSLPSAGAFGILGFAGGMMGALSESLVKTVLLAMQWAFANILEIAMLLSGLMGPFAIAGAIAFEGKSLWAWLTGFFALGMAQISYNIIVGLAAVVVVNADVTDTLGFLVIISILAPALALALAAGGGMAVFHVISSGVAGIATTLVGGSPRLALWRDKHLFG